MLTVHRQMGEHGNPAGYPGVAPTVYIIVRVFKLGTRDVGLRVYLDPDVMRREGRLIFTGETWSVRPA